MTATVSATISTDGRQLAVTGDWTLPNAVDLQRMASRMWRAQLQSEDSVNRVSASRQ